MELGVWQGKGSGPYSYSNFSPEFLISLNCSHILISSLMFRAKKLVDWVPLLCKYKVIITYIEHNFIIFKCF